MVFYLTLKIKNISLSLSVAEKQNISIIISVKTGGFFFQKYSRVQEYNCEPALGTLGEEGVKDAKAERESVVCAVM